MTDRWVPDDDLDPPDWVNTGASLSRSPTPDRRPPPRERRPPPREHRPPAGRGAPERRPPTPDGRGRREAPPRQANPPRQAAPPPPRPAPPASGAPTRGRTMTWRPPERRPPPPADPDLGMEDADEYLDDELGDGDGDGESRAARRAAREAHRADRKRLRRRNFAALGIVSLVVVPFFVVGGWFVYQLNPPGGPGQRVELTIEPGWGVSEIADRLEDEGVIGSSLAFQLYAKVRGAGPFQPGPYQLNKNLGVRDAVSKLDTGPKQGNTDIELTLPPGLTLQQIAQKVEEQLPGRTAAKFLEVANSGVVRSRYQPAEVTSLEGLLFPETYLVAKSLDEEAILRRLVEEFDNRADAAGVATGAAAIGRTPYEAIVIGSLIEREAGVEEDRPLISAVVFNRLRDGMLLQIDATLCYAKGGCTEPLSNADKEIDSPYNTYKVAALPPTPISSVGEASLRAAMAPAAVPFKFYVLSEADGRHAFAETQEQHDNNVNAAREKGLL